MKPSKYNCDNISGVEEQVRQTWQVPEIEDLVYIETSITFIEFALLMKSIEMQMKFINFIM